MANIAYQLCTSCDHEKHTNMYAALHLNGSRDVVIKLMDCKNETRKKLGGLSGDDDEGAPTE